MDKIWDKLDREAKGVLNPRKVSDWIEAGGVAAAIEAGSGKIYTDELETGAIQDFIDGYIAAHPQVRVDYIHGADAVRTLAQTPGAVGFLYGGLRRDELFDYVRENGILPRKSFSVGQACDKRYYMEARRIR